ncbi:hypothetical protein [Bradyrhizobium sp. NAS80.1]|uniref:hypothetical protein n=1 Tax=Bradyrhizobium sp. NAS80.1 TaxID=1680159 RepID=UPI001161214F|nr:hypothetical protein [Bradyrhizobium sp. NAS80.1]
MKTWSLMGCASPAPSDRRPSAQQLWRCAVAPFTAVVRFIAPEPIGCPPDPPHVSLDWLLGLSLHASLCVMLARLMPGTAPHADQVFWLGVALLYFPISVRIAAPQVARSERIWLLLVLAEATFALKALFDPTGFVQFDEFQHWRSADDILTTHRLFVRNDLLFVSPFYPGLELVTTALIHLTGLTVFAAGNVVIALCRAVFITALFTFFERITGSARLAGIGSLGYMGSTTYVMFDAQFAYESLGVAFMAVILMMEAETAARGTTLPRTMVLALPLLAALAITHHVTNYFTVAVLCALAAMALTLRLPSPMLAAAGAVATALGWVTFIGNPTSGYLGPVITEGAQEFAQMLQGHVPHRELYHAEDGVTSVPVWLSIGGLGSVLVLCVLLSFGFLTACAAGRGPASGRTGWYALQDLLRRRCDNPRLLLVSLLALLWPLSVLLRLTPAGWQVGNRMSAFAFIGVGLVAAFGVARFWRARAQWTRGIVAGFALALVAVGGMINGWGPAAVRTQYRVEGDALSVDPMGIDAAAWTARWLGPNQNFVTDLENSALLLTYGRQHIVTLPDAKMTAGLFISPVIWEGLRDAIRDRRIDYLLVDMRLSTQPALLGLFFQAGEPDGLGLTPLDPTALQRWDGDERVNRVFDDGWIRIYDVRALQYAR